MRNGNAALGISVLALASAAMPALGTVAPRAQLTVADTIQAEKALSIGPGPLGRGAPLSLSPDGQRYLVVVTRGDLEKDGLEARFLSGRTESLVGAVPTTAATLFTRALGNMPVTMNLKPKWLDGSRVLFIWDGSVGPKKLLELDLATGALVPWLEPAEEMIDFAASSDGRTVAFTAFAPRDTSGLERLRAFGFTVPVVATNPGFGFFDGNIDGWEKWEQVRIYLADGPGGALRAVSRMPVFGAYYPAAMQFSPDGLSLLVDMPVGAIPESWRRYTNPWLQKDVLADADAHDGRSFNLRRWYVIDVVSGECRPLWDAPAHPGGVALWAPDSRRIVVGPTFLPPAGADSPGLAGEAFAVVDSSTGDFAPLPLSVASEGRRTWRPVRWQGGVLEFAPTPATAERIRLRESGGSWHPLGEEGDRGVPAKSPTVEVEWRQDLRTPPALYGRARETGEERLLLALNPSLTREFMLGRVESINWEGMDGRRWSGLLYYPPGHETAGRRPLVIQTHGYSAAEFSLIGHNINPTTYCAQPLANRGMLVLQMGGIGIASPRIASTAEEAPAVLAGFVGAVRHLDRLGLVDPARVGLSGFSRTGWHVEYAIAHADMLFAAAIAADNIDSGYVQSMLKGWPAGLDAGNGGPAFGSGLKAWLENAPAFNAERVRTPLRLQVNSGGLIWGLQAWEIFSRLRFLRKPVELYFPPRLGQGTHNLQNPRQVLASAGGALDWFDFWLNGHERADPHTIAGETKKDLVEQYARWRKLRQLHEADLKQPRPPRLKWTATPITEDGK